MNANTKNDGIIFPFSNSIIFSLVMQDAQRCRKLLERLAAEDPFAQLAGERGRGSAERWIAADPFHKSVQLDVLFEGDDSWYDIEMQVEKVRNIPKRSRYYHSVIASHLLKRGSGYEQLKPCYVIFLCEFDLFGKGEAVYRFENYDVKNSLPLGDEAFTIILNSKCAQEKVPEELKSLFAYLNREGAETGDDFIQDIHRRVLELNAGEELRHVISIEQDMEWRVKWMVEDAKEEFKEEYKKEFMEKYKAEYEEKVRAEIEEKVRAEIREEVYSELKAELKEELEAETAEAAADDQRRETAKQIKAEGISEEIICRCTGLPAETVKEL